MKKTLYILALSLFFQSAIAQQLTPISTEVVADSLFIPWELLYGKDNKIWFTQKNGYICRLDPATHVVDTVYQEPLAAVNNEGGMLGLAVEFANNLPLYVYVAWEYYNSGNYTLRITKHTYSNNTLTNAQILIDNIEGASIHNGCRLLLVDDKLFITTGDAADQILPQNVTSLNGKILRINTDGTIPNDNPNPSSPIWSWGHRNAQGLVMHNGILYSSEHGPSTDDEVNIIQKGRNYGWPEVHGYCDGGAEIIFCSDSNVVEPLVAWTPTIAPSGIDYFNSSDSQAFLNHVLLMTSLKDNNLYSHKLNAAGDAITASTTVNNINYGRLRDLCIAPNNMVYVSTSNSSASGSGSKVDKIIAIKFTETTGLTNLTQAAFNVTVFPNPTKNILRLNIDDNIQSKTNYYYQVFNVQGNKLLTGTLNGAVDIASLDAGIYYIKLTNTKGISAYQRFVVY